MLITADEAVQVAKDMARELDRANDPRRGHFGRVDRYLDGKHDLPYMPRGATNEYRALARKAITNWLPLVSETFSQILFVDDYQTVDGDRADEVWKLWQRNKMDARQTIAHRGALDYGVGWCSTFPAGPGDAVIKPIQATRVWAEYEDDDDEWPQRVLVRKGKDLNGNQLYELVDDEVVYTILRPKDGKSEWTIEAEATHDMGYAPFIRFRDRLDGRNRGIVAQLITLQDRVNEAVFNLLIALQYASFRQRWATGLAIPTDTEGNPIEPFSAAIDRLWVTENEEAKFGEFSQTDVSGHMVAYESAVSSLAAIGRISPTQMLGKLVNLSADALAAAEAVTQRAGGQFETLFGECWEQVLESAAYAAQIELPDASARVRWRDTEARALAATTDALGKMAQMLSIPPEALWPRIPGVTKDDVIAWKALKPANADGIDALASALTKSATPTAGLPASRDELPTAANPAPGG